MDSKDHNSAFHRAIRKYGFENFKWEIIQENILEEFLDIVEIYQIAINNSYYTGYNETFGGDCTRGYKPSFEQKQKISKTLKERFKDKRRHPNFGKKHKKLSEKRKGSGNPMFGKIPWNKGKKIK